MRSALRIWLIFSAAAAIACEECESSRDCAPGSVCIDAICEVQSEVSARDEDCDGGVMGYSQSGGALLSQDCGGGGSKEDNPGG